MSYFQLWAVWSDGTVKNKNTIAGTFGSASIQRNTQVAKGRIPRSRFTGGCSREWLCGTVPHAVEDRQAMRFADLVENPASGAAAGDQPPPAQKIQILRNRPLPSGDALYNLRYGGLAAQVQKFNDAEPLDVSQQLLMQRYAGNAAKKDIHESNMPYLQACREAAQYLYEQDHGKTWQVLPCCSGTALRSVTEMHQAILQEIKKRFS